MRIREKEHGGRKSRLIAFQHVQAIPSETSTSITLSTRDSVTHNPTRYTMLCRRQHGVSRNNPHDQTTESQPEDGDFEDLVGSPGGGLSVRDGKTGQEALNPGDALPAGNAGDSWYPVDSLASEFSSLNGEHELRHLSDPMDSLNALSLPNQSPTLLQSPFGFGPMPSITDPSLLSLDRYDPELAAIADQPGSPRQIILSVSKPSVTTANLLFKIASGIECEQCRLKVKR